MTDITYTLDEFIRIAIDRGVVPGANKRDTVLKWAHSQGKSIFDEDDIIRLYNAMPCGNGYPSRNRHYDDYDDYADSGNRNSDSYDIMEYWREHNDY